MRKARSRRQKLFPFFFLPWITHRCSRLLPLPHIIFFVAHHFGRVVLWATSPKFEVSPFYWRLCCHFSNARCGVWWIEEKKRSIPWRHEVQSNPCRFWQQHPSSRSVSCLIWQVVESKHPKPNCINIWKSSTETRLAPDGWWNFVFDAQKDPGWKMLRWFYFHLGS